MSQMVRLTLKILAAFEKLFKLINFLNYFLRKIQTLQYLENS